MTEYTSPPPFFLSHFRTCSSALSAYKYSPVHRTALCSLNQPLDAFKQSSHPSALSLLSSNEFSSSLPLPSLYTLKVASMSTDAEWSALVRGWVNLAHSERQAPQPLPLSEEDLRLTTQQTTLEDVPVLMMENVPLPGSTIHRASVSSMTDWQNGLCIGVAPIIEEREEPGLEIFLHSHGTLVRCSPDGSAVGLVRCRLYRSSLSHASVTTLPDVSPSARPPPRTPLATYHPPFAWRLFDERWLVLRLAETPLVRKLASASLQKALGLPPSKLSFRLAEHLPLSAAQRKSLLAAPHTPSRLRLLLRLASKPGAIHCTACDCIVADAASAVLIGEGGIHCNRYGAQHSVWTCTAVREGCVVLSEDDPTSVDTWFPPYEWVIASCGCGAHLGWQFTRPAAAAAAENEGRPDLPLFWGLSLRSIEHRACEAEEGEESEWRPGQAT